jgi:hypothetical protein
MTLDWEKVSETEQILEKLYNGKVISLSFSTPKYGDQEKTGILDRLALDTSKAIPQVVLIFRDGKRHAVTRDDFFIKTKLLN